MEEASALRLAERGEDKYKKGENLCIGIRIRCSNVLIALIRSFMIDVKGNYRHIYWNVAVGM